MYCVGLIGNIASGKSTVSTFFSELGIDVISADHIAKMLTAVNQPAYHLIVNHFDHSILSENGELNRRSLRQIIFNNTNERIWLEQLLHPLIRETIEQQISHCKSPYCVIEIPLLKDRSIYPYLNRVLLICSETSLQIARLKARDNDSEKQALAILGTQPKDTDRAQISDDILMNNGSLSELKEKILKLHTNYLQYSGYF